eukprot:Seg745.5 transcript_id=Seg745.5/GoldUCD/mRNA.D3Y31 product="EGF domain-specific O-linked N-acetylglucosamine transferase" protein_id=Seg745.5/GoldUCD/D3Y31
MCSQRCNYFVTTILIQLGFMIISSINSQEYGNLPEVHLKFFGQHSSQVQHCDAKNKDCNEHKIPQTLRHEQPCWGYEKHCNPKHYFTYPICSSHDPRWARTMADQQKIFWEQGDFGYLKKFMDGMMTLCKPREEGDSSLRCSSNLAFCHAKNIYMNFKDLRPQTSNDRFKEDVFQKGDIGGHCNFNEHLHRKQGAHKSPLQSWYAELENYSYLKEKPIESGMCDVVLDKPTFFIKLDAGINMFHHFCDFVNLYASQHMNGSFSTDVYIVMWDTSNMGYRDFFEDTWKAFTDYPIIRLDSYDKQKVCVRDAVFPLLARMIRGLYYNMPVVPGCQNSGLFKAFSEHVLHRLGIEQDQYKDDVYRVTLLVRNTQYRNILNQNELIGAMKRYSSLNVTVVEYNPTVPFLKQIHTTHNSDIFIGMHGAGLTHLLFLPDWAVIFELYNTEDPDCYRDLASLRGVKYITWQNKETLFQQDKGNHPTLGEHAKFTNYAFQVREFMRLLEEAIGHVNIKRPIMTSR